MPDKKLIAVVGATGSQGNGLVRAILEDPASRFAVRALTRDANSDKGRALAAAVHELREEYAHPYFWAPFVLVGDPGAPALYQEGGCGSPM